MLLHLNKVMEKQNENIDNIHNLLEATHFKVSKEYNDINQIKDVLYDRSKISYLMTIKDYVTPIVPIIGIYYPIISLVGLKTGIIGGVGSLCTYMTYKWYGK